jgi:hypothetical protein
MYGGVIMKSLTLYNLIYENKNNQFLGNIVQLGLKLKIILIPYKFNLYEFGRKWSRRTSIIE